MENAEPPDSDLYDRLMKADNPYERFAKDKLRIFCVAACAMLAIWLAGEHWNHPQELAWNFTTQAGVESDTVAEIVTAPFTLAERGRRTSVYLSLRRGTGWEETDLAVTLSLENQDNGRAYTVTLRARPEVGQPTHYSDTGPDIDHGARRLAKVEGGRYQLRFKPSWEVTPACGFPLSCPDGFQCENKRCQRTCKPSAVSLTPLGPFNPDFCYGPYVCSPQGRCVRRADAYRIILERDDTVPSGLLLGFLLLMGSVVAWSFFRANGFNQQRMFAKRKDPIVSALLARTVVTRYARLLRAGLYALLCALLLYYLALCAAVE